MTIWGHCCVQSNIHISDGNLHEVNVLDRIIFEPGSFYVMDRGLVDSGRLHTPHRAQAFFVIRAKSNLQYRRLYPHPVEKCSGLRCDQTIALTDVRSGTEYPVALRRIKFYDATHDKLLVFLTNHFDLPALQPDFNEFAAPSGRLENRSGTAVDFQVSAGVSCADCRPVRSCMSRQR